jgi:N-acetyl-anhydromuramyl-L-alanine amidase AmpD
MVTADSAHRGGSRNVPPALIVIHATAGTNSLAWLSTDPNSAVSAHVLISKEGQVHRIVEDSGIAYHAGVSKWGRYGTPGQPSINTVSLGVELENLNTGNDPYPEAQVIALARLVYRWIMHYGWLPQVSHQEIAPTRKTDPAGFPWARYRQILDEYIQGVRT